MTRRSRQQVLRQRARRLKAVRRFGQVRRRGFVLVGVLVVVTILSLSAYSFSRWMRLEMEAAGAQHRTIQARLLAESGIELARALLISRRHGLPIPEATNNPELFRSIALFEEDEEIDPRVRGHFSVVAPLEDRIVGAGEYSNVRFGWTDESAKLDLNSWAERDPIRLREVLATSLLVPQDTARAIVDWIDRAESSGSAVFGSSFADLLDDYRPKNGPLECIDELLSVRGVTRQLLYRDDAAQSRAVDLYGLGSIGSVPLADSVTIYARSSESDRFGRERIWLNDPDLAELYRAVRDEFSVELARFVIAFRVLGTGVGPTADEATPFGDVAGAGSDTEDAEGEPGTGPGRNRFTSVVDLVDGRVSGTWEGVPIEVESPISQSSPTWREDLERILDRMSVAPNSVREGTINFNAASKEVLAILSDLSPAQREAIVARRDAASPSTLDASSDDGLAWLITNGILSLDEYRLIEPYVTGRSEVFRVRCIGSYVDGGPFAQIEAVVDGTRNPPELAFYRDAGPPRGSMREAVRMESLPHTLPNLSGMFASSSSGARQ